jgi:murein DD-endopeptidase MepM/ murein hydrolase activator NlpD
MDARRKHRPITHGFVLMIISLAVGYVSITGGPFHSRGQAFAAPVTGLSLPGVSSSVPAVDQSALHPLTINKTIRTDQQAPPSQKQEAERLAVIQATPTTQPAAPPADAVVREAVAIRTPDAPAYQVIQVEDGDTVSTIATKSGVKSEYILANNIEIRDSDFLTIGQSIIVPAANGILHEVRLDETLGDIAARYDVEVTAIEAFPANRITSPDDIRERQMVFVPDAVIPVALPAPVASSTASDGALADSTPVPSDSSGDSSDSSGAASSDYGLIWPVSGPISSYYGPSHPLGIDVDGYRLGGASIAAATSGTVLFAGGNACCSYGLYVVVMSPGGIETLYAHLSQINVSQGETVGQGESIGVIGSSGYSTGVHLHFEVIDNGVRVNPTSYLP